MADTPFERPDPGITGATVADDIVSSGGPIPAMNVMDTIVADTNAALVQSSTTEAKVVANLGAAEQASNQLVELSRQRAADTATVTATQEAAKLRTQQYTLAAANKAGVDPTKAADFMLSQIEQFQQGAEKTAKAYENWREKKNSRLLDDPVKWVDDLLSLPEANRQIRMAEQQTAVAAKNITAMNNIIQQTANTSMQIKESTTAAAADAATRLAANEANQAAVQNSLNSIKYNSAALDASMNASKDRLALLYNLKSAQQQEKAQAIVLEKFQQDRKEFDWRKDVKEAEVAAKAEGKDIDQYVVDNINLGRAARGLPPLTGNAMKTSMLRFKNGDKEMALDFKNGEATAVTGNTTLAASPSEAIANITNYRMNLPPDKDRLIAVLQGANEALAKNPALAGSKDQDAKDKFIDDYVKKTIAGQYADGNKSAANVFNVGELSSYLQLSAIADLPVTKKLLAPASQAGIKMDDPKAVLELGVAAVNKGTITSSEFAGLATVYQMANEINLRASNPFGLGIQLPNGGRNYYVQTQTFGAAMDITNPTELTRYYSNQAAEALGKKQTEDVRQKYGRPGTPNAMRRMMQDQVPTDPTDMKQGQ